MSETFNPYRKWLGIPESECPPNHYALLGIEPLESDPDVISVAADRVMMFLRTYQSGMYAEYSQKLLNEVSAARVCLLNAHRKAEYDQTLHPSLVSTVSNLEPEIPKGMVSEMPLQTVGNSDASSVVPPLPVGGTVMPPNIPAPPIIRSEIKREMFTGKLEIPTEITQENITPTPPVVEVNIRMPQGEKIVYTSEKPFLTEEVIQLAVSGDSVEPKNLDGPASDRSEKLLDKKIITVEEESFALSKKFFESEPEPEFSWKKIALFMFLGCLGVIILAFLTSYGPETPPESVNAKKVAVSQKNDDESVMQADVINFSGSYDVIRTLEKIEWETLNVQKKLRELDLSYTSITDSDLERIKKHETLTRLSLKGCKKITDAGLMHLASLKNLQQLELSGCVQINGDGLSILSGMKDLSVLALMHCTGLKDLSIRHIRLSKLTGLDLTGCASLTDEVVKQFDSQMKWLDETGKIRWPENTVHGLVQNRAVQRRRTLELPDYATDSGLDALCAVKYLVKLDLSKCEKLTDEGMKYLSRLTHLKELILPHANKITDAGIIELASCAGLEFLDMSGCALVTDKGVSALKKLTLLTSVNLSGCDLVTDIGLAELSELPLSGSVSWPKNTMKFILSAPEKYNLESFSPPQFITDAGMAQLKGMRRLKKLELTECNLVTDTGLSYLYELECLESLVLNRCENITGSGLTYLKKKKKLSELRIVSCRNVKKDIIKHISVLDQLRILELSDCEGLTYKIMEVISGLPQLRELYLTIPEDSLKYFSPEKLDLPRLERLYINGSKVPVVMLQGLMNDSERQKIFIEGDICVTPVGLARMKNSSLVRNVVVRGTQFTEKQILQLTGITQMETLELSGQKTMTDAWLKHLLKLEKLISLDLSECPLITAEGVTQLTDLKKLQVLSLRNCEKISLDEVLKLTKMFPRCKIKW